MTTTFKQLSLDTIWNLSWNQAKKHFITIFAMNFIIWLCGQISGLFANTTPLLMTLKDMVKYDDPELIANMMMPMLLSILPMLLLGSFIGWLASSYFSVSLYRLLMDGVKEMKLDMGERIKGSWTGYINYIITVFVYNLVIAIATCLCILPGIFLSVRLLLVPIIAANKPHQSLGDTFSESWNLTRGHFWTLIGYGIVAGLINIVGFICCCVGVLFTIIITQFMLANVYYMLSYEEPEKEIVVEEEIIATASEA